MIPSSHFTALPSHFTALRAIDSHTGGEPTRLIIEGFPDLGRGSMAERKVLFAQQYDAWRRAIILEPRGNDVLVGALLCQPCSPQATAGVIFSITRVIWACVGMALLV